MNNNHEALQDYSNSIKLFKQQCRDSGVTEEEFKQLYLESLKDVQKELQQTRGARPKIVTIRRFFIFSCILLVIVIYNIKTIHSTLQEYIYPGLQLLRRLSIPFISLFPSLTEYYHETCLLHNPFFTIVDMECWPCSTIHNIHEIDEPDISNQPNNAPFIYKTDQKVVNIYKLKNLFQRNADVFNQESPKILTNNKYNLKPNEVFNKLTVTGDKNLYIWKFNTMNTARILRQEIPRPKVVPKFGQSTERFIIIDNSQQSFHLPDTECNFSFVLALSGSRVIELIPAEECKHQCKTLQIELKENYLLWYNWWYWKPRVQLSNGNETIIAHVGSYC